MLKEIRVDPTRYFTKNGYEFEWIMEAGGFIPHWVAGADEETSQRKLAEQNYGYPPYECENTKISESGMFDSCDGDPELYPLMVVIGHNGQKTWSYLYGFVAFEEIDKNGNTTHFVCRMD